MIKIKKDVAHKLHNEYGVKWKENGISKTHTKHPNYYLCESEYNLRSYLKIENNEIAQKSLDRMLEKKKYRKYRQDD